MTTPTIDALWKGYQIGQGSADHTAKEVFAEVIGPVLRDLVAAQEELKEAQEKLAAARAGIAQLKADLAARDAELAELMKWKEAVVNELIVAHIYSQAHDDSPRKAVHDAITWHCQVEIDPAVSSDARKLRDTYLQRAEAAERKAEENARDAARWKVCLDAEGVAVSIFNCDPASWRYPEGDQLVAAIDAIRTGADNAWSVPIHKCEPVHDESPPHDAAIAAKGEA